MKAKELLKLVLTGVCLMGFTSTFAQDSANDQADVWTIIEGQWDAQEKGDKDWADEMLTEDFTGWLKNSPAPRSKTSTKMWNRVNEMTGKMIAHELYPLSIVVRGDVAVAHYLYRSAIQSTDESIEMGNGRYTDVLVRTDDGWKFLSWHGGKD
ncbi:MAG: nuclear transport factor 2 family protein [Gammaproteobacteria bacterium]|nr:nuclear transport factor 2 family protein [Gammaproteobacteria bacterium]MDH5239198.1 nuclear transport factor 2 family protein [Gammaproteobacteria bacterium]MDH5260921.1 nuclear transport factor 2 family protein [Gammaproteobacteria bacterium]MDH5582441.1 nuclear transport factor 2 family protein [Gammaproteobacteria bacterium]